MKSIIKLTINIAIAILLIISLGFNANKLVILSKHQPLTVNEYIANDTAIWFTIIMGILQGALLFLVIYIMYNDYKRRLVTPEQEKEIKNLTKNIIDKLNGLTNKEIKPYDYTALPKFFTFLKTAHKMGYSFEIAVKEYNAIAPEPADERMLKFGKLHWACINNPDTAKHKEEPLKDALHNVVFEKKEDIVVSNNEDFDRRVEIAEFGKPVRTDYPLGQKGNTDYDRDYQNWWINLPEDIADYLSKEK